MGRKPINDKDFYEELGKKVEKIVYRHIARQNMRSYRKKKKGK